MNNNKHIVKFSLLTLTLSWIFIGLFNSLGGEWKGIQAMIFGVLYMYFPLFSSLIYNKTIYKNYTFGFASNFKLNYFWLVAWLIMPLIALLTLLINIQLPGYEFSNDLTGYLNQIKDSIPPEQMEEAIKELEKLPLGIFWIALLNALFAGTSINALAAFGEEYGWRGFLFHLFKGKSFFKTSLFIGFIWGIWHAPLILMGHNYPNHNVIGVFVMILFCILLSPIFNYLRIKSNSVIAISILHGTLNASAGISITMLTKTHDLISGITGFCGFTALLVALILLALYDIFISKEKIMLNKI